MQVRNTIKFAIMNPTNEDYTYMWINEDENNPKKASSFQCLTQEGHVRSGKQADVSESFLCEKYCGRI